MIKSTFKKLKHLVVKPSNYPLRKGINRNYIFIHINKTGGTSIAKALDLPDKRHLTLRQVSDIIGQKEIKKSYIFTVVRNPWDKVVSHFKYRTRTNQTKMKSDPISFKKWVKCTYGKDKDLYYYDNPIMFSPQVEWIKNKDGIIQDVKVIKFETLTLDFKEVAKTIGILNTLPHLNATRKDNYVDYYDDETIEIIRNWFHEDIERFDYKFDNKENKGL